MEPYSIRCTTCRAKLKVRRPDAIGQLCSCPKCGSMVMIHPPGPHDDAADDTLPLHRGRVANPHDVGTASYESVHELLDESGVGQQETHTEAAAVTATVAATSRANRTHKSHADVTMKLTRTMSGLRIVSRAALLVVAMGGGATLALIMFYASKSDADAPINLPVIEDRETPSMANEPVKAATSQSDEPSTAAADPLLSTGTPRSQPAAPSITETAPPPEPTVADRERDSAPQSEPALSNSGPLVSSAATAEPQPSVHLARLQTALKPVLPVSTEPKKTIPQPPRMEVDVPARLADPIGKLHLPKASLKATIRLLASMSTVPITIDASALRYGIRPESNVSVNADLTSVSDVLEQTIAPLKLKAEVIGNQVSVQHVSATRRDLREVAHDVHDLVTEKTPVSVLARLVQELVSCDSWSEQGGQAQVAAQDEQLVITQTHSGHLDTAMLLDQLRAARGLAASGRFADHVIQTGLPWRGADRQLAERITLRHTKPMRLGRLAEEIEQSAGINILVDWRHLIEEGWHQATMVSVNQWQEPAELALQNVVAQFGGTYRAVNDNTVMLTTISAEREMVDVVFFPVDDLIDTGHDVAQIIELTKQAIGVGSFREQGGVGSLVFDPVSQQLIVRLPQSELRTVAQVMANWRSL